MNLPIAYQWLGQEGAPRHLLKAVELYGVTEAIGSANNPAILGWAKELGLEKDYTADSIPWCGLFVAITMIITEVARIKAGLIDKEPKIIYRYIPRTFEEEQLDPVFVTDVFDTMFSQPSPWVSSIKSYDERKQEKINQYFVTQL